MTHRTVGDIWRERRGATAIAYGILAGGIAVSISAAVLLLGGGVGDLFGAATRTVSGDAAELRVVLTQTFETGNEGWRGMAPRRTLDRIGTGLSLSRESRIGDGREAMSRVFDIPVDSRRAEISFDMSFVDSWDNEQAKVYVNGTEVMVGGHRWNGSDAPVLVETPAEVLTIDAQLTNSVQAGTWSGGLNGTDYTYRVTIAVDDPGETLRLGFGTTLDQGQTDESLLIGNVELRAGP